MPIYNLPAGMKKPILVVDRADLAEADCLEGRFRGGIVCHVVFGWLSSRLCGVVREG